MLLQRKYICRTFVTDNQSGYQKQTNNNFMNNFEKLKKENKNLAEVLESVAKEELLEYCASEFFQKKELEQFKYVYEDYQEDLEQIINAAKKWLVKREKTNHYLHISTEKIQLIQKENIETEWI